MTYPPEIKSLITQCEANVQRFDNDKMSSALLEVQKLASIMACVARETTCQWSRNYLTCMLKARGYDPD